MNPSENQSGIELPPVVGQVGGLPGVSPERTTASAEKTLTQPEQSPAIGRTTPAVVPVLSLPIPAIPSQDDVTTTTQTMANAADDDDLIEKEWVNKAKKIVEATRDDPYKQSEELTVVKVDYMQKRYNKTVKLDK